jgi:hypothetical protein
VRNVFQAQTLTEAGLVRNLLVENGIDAKVVGERASFSGIALSEVWISNDHDRERAVELVRELYSTTEEGPLWECVACGESSPESFELCWQCGAPHAS